MLVPLRTPAQDDAVDGTEGRRLGDGHVTTQLIDELLQRTQTGVIPYRQCALCLYDAYLLFFLNS